MDYTKLQNDINKFWDNEIVPTLTDYIKIPNKSPAFDPQWKENGHMDKVLHLAKEWVEKFRPENSTLHIKEVENRTPIMLLEIAGDRDGNILMYGHLDKQPEMEGWNDGMGPWTPVIKDESTRGIAMSFKRLMNIVPKGAIQSDVKLPQPELVAIIP